MRLAINATALLSPLTGIGQYCVHLAQGLLEQPGLEIGFFYGSRWDTRLRTSHSPASAKLLPWLRGRLPHSYALRRRIQNFLFSRGAGRGKFDLYHEPNNLPLRFEGPTVVTVHDLSWIRYPEAHPAERVMSLGRYFERGLKQASAIITDSAFIQQELIELFGIAPGRITPIPLGVEPMFTPRSAAQTADVLGRHQLTHGRYFLAVGTLEPRKNLSLALNAYQRLPAKIQQAHPLVVIGMKGWHTKALEEQLAPLVRSGEVRQLGYLPRPELATLLAGASALVYPSFYEGFGLPPLEAMACGVPVICSDASSLPEVVGDAGILIEPRDEGDLVRAMTRIVEDDRARADLARRASERATGFTWARCVDRTMAVYRSVVA